MLSQSVPVRLDIWGEPIERGDAVGPNIVSPFYASNASGDPVKQEIARLRVPLSMPQRSLTVDGEKVQLSPQQYADYVRLSGQAAKSWLDSYTRSDEWRSMTDDQRRDAVTDGFKDFRDAARDELKARYPELRGSLEEAALPPPNFTPAQPVSNGIPPLPPGFKIINAPRAPQAALLPKRRGQGMFAGR
jgi:hypothetical protein